MNKRYTLILILYCFVFCGGRALGQQKMADSLQLNKTTVNMAVLFNKAVIQQSRLYNGPAFVPYNFVTTTNANFRDTTDFYNGTVNYDGVVYTNVPLIYNINRDMLVSHLYNGVTLYSLLNDKVYEFDIFNRHFIHLQPDNLNKEMQDGYYEELYNGKTQVLIRHNKQIEQESIRTGTNRFFVEKTAYFIKKGDKYYNAGSEGKIEDALKDKKKELKQYLKDNKLRFNDNPEHVMAALAAYYDHLTN